MLLLLAAACTPTVALVPSRAPIVIDLNIKIEHRVITVNETAAEDLADFETSAGPAE